MQGNGEETTAFGNSKSGLEQYVDWASLGKGMADESSVRPLAMPCPARGAAGLGPSVKHAP